MTSKASTFLSHIICFAGCKKCLLSIAYGFCKFSPAEAGVIEATWKDLYRVSWKCYFLIAHRSSREMPTPLNPQEPSKEKTMIYQKRYFQIEATTHLEVTSFVQYVYMCSLGIHALHIHSLVCKYHSGTMKPSHKPQTSVPYCAPYSHISKK